MCKYRTVAKQSNFHQVVNLVYEVKVASNKCQAFCKVKNSGM